MLRANSHEFSHFVHFIEKIDVIAGSFTRGLFNQASQHRNSCRLASTIMTKQSKNLALIHLDADALNSLKATRERLFDIRDLQIVVGCLKSLTKDWRRLVVFSRHLSALKLVIIVILRPHDVVNKVLSCPIVVILDGCTSASLSPAASVVAWREAEAWIEPLSEVLRDDLVQVKSKPEKEHEVEHQHPQGRVKRVIIVDHRGCESIDASSCALVVGKDSRALHQGHLRKERGSKFLASRRVFIIDQSVAQDTTEVHNCGDDSCVLATSEHGLQEDDLAEDGLSIEPEEDPYVEWRGVVDDVGHQNAPCKCRHNCVDRCVENEP